VDLDELECGCMLGRDIAADISRTSSVIDIEAFGGLVVAVLLFVLLWLSCLTPSAEAVDITFASIEDVLLLADTVVVSLPAPVVECPVACCLSVLSVLGTSPSLCDSARVTQIAITSATRTIRCMIQQATICSSERIGRQCNTVI